MPKIAVLHLAWDANCELTDNFHFGYSKKKTEEWVAFNEMLLTNTANTWLDINVTDADRRETEEMNCYCLLTTQGWFSLSSPAVHLIFKLTLSPPFNVRIQEFSPLLRASGTAYLQPWFPVATKNHLCECPCVCFNDWVCAFVRFCVVWPSNLTRCW